MCLITLLGIIGIVTIIIATLILVTGGSAFILVFGDLIVCAVLIILLIRWLFKRKKK